MYKVDELLPIDTVNERATVPIATAMKMMGVSRRTIYNWMQSGKVTYLRTAGGSVRIFTHTLWRQTTRSLPKGDQQ